MSASLPGGAVPVARPVRAAYGVAELGIAGVEVLIRVGLLIFYTDVVGLDPRLAGYAVALGVVWDAVTDPLMGRISDRSRFRAGRRRPWMALGALALALSVVLLFSPPAMEGQSGKFLVLLGSYILVNTAMTLIAVPYSALAGDLCPPGEARTELFGWRLLFANVGLVLGTALPGLLVAGDGVAARAEADLRTAWILGGITLLTAAIAIVATRGHDRPAPAARSTVAFSDAIRLAVTNRFFVPLFLAYLIANIGLNVNATTALYYYRYRLQLDEGETRFIIAVFMLVFCLSIPVWLRIARRFGKRRSVVFGASVLGVMNCIVYLLFPVGDPYWPLLASVIGGIAIGCVVLLEALLADVVDHDRVFSRESRFGLYFGLWRMGSKVARAVAIALAGNVLAWIGFTANAAQDPAASLGIAIIFGPGVGVFFLVAAGVLLAYRLDAAVHDRVLRILARRDARGLSRGA